VLIAAVAQHIMLSMHCSSQRSRVANWEHAGCPCALIIVCFVSIRMSVYIHMDFSAFACFICVEETKAVSGGLGLIVACEESNP
jgi:hypothetical protein